MIIEKESIAGFDNNEVKYDKSDYPKPPKGSHLPLPYYVCLLIGSTGTGKTQALVKLLKYLEKAKYYNNEGEEVKQRIWLFCPTAEANPIYKTLKNLDPADIVTEYTDSALTNTLDEIKQIKEEAEDYQKLLKVWRKFEKSKTDKNITNEEIMTLELMNWEAPIPPKYATGIANHIILDDLLAQPNAFKANGNSAISNLTVKCRHYSSNVYVLGQSSAQIPKIVRIQARLLMLYRFNSKKITEELYDVVSSLLSPEEFEKIYDDATAKKYNFLTVDNTGSDLILKQNLNILIKIKRQKKISKGFKPKTIHDQQVEALAVEGKK